MFWSRLVVWYCRNVFLLYFLFVGLGSIAFWFVIYGWLFLQFMKLHLYYLHLLSCRQIRRPRRDWFPCLWRPAWRRPRTLTSGSQMMALWASARFCTNANSAQRSLWCSHPMRPSFLMSKSSTWKKSEILSLPSKWCDRS